MIELNSKPCSDQIQDDVLSSSSGPTINSPRSPKLDTPSGQLKPGSIVLSGHLLVGGLKTLIQEGKKKDEGKIGVQLLPPAPLEEIAKVLDFGAKKYDAWNWSKGIRYSRVYGAALRHLWAWYRGKDVDSETGLSHLAHAGCCVLFLLQYTLTPRLHTYDDRPTDLKEE